MGIFGAMNIGITGIQAQSARIGATSQNIANLDTDGYKLVRAEFVNLIGSRIAGSVDTGGVRDVEMQINSLQGEVIISPVNTDIAIDGNGFFAVRQSASTTDALLYTRAGSFRPDADGNLRNGAGFYLQGWPLDTQGELATELQGADIDSGTAISALRTVNAQQFDQIPVPTGAMALHMNLDAAQDVYAGAPVYDATDPAANMTLGGVQPHFRHPLTVVDSTGVAHTVHAGFLKTGVNSWAVELYAATPADTASGAAQVASGTLTFNGDGTLASVSPALAQVGIAWSNGADASSIAMNWGTAGPIFGTPGATVVGRSDGVTQFDSGFTIGATIQDGLEIGRLESITVSAEGYLVSNYDNGGTRRLYMIPLVKFVDPNQLDAQTGTVFQTSLQASEPDFLRPGEGGSGTLRGNSLERSNADESTELTHLIVAQRSYQFNSQLISRTDGMMETLTQMVA